MSIDESSKTNRAQQEWHQRWATAAFRVAKPGAYLLAFGGTRTYHRLACAIEDAGWVIRDTLVWCYAQGFAKSLSPYRSTMAGICRSHALAPHAVRVSAWHPLASPAAKEPTALALAEIQPEGDLLLLIRTGEAVGSFDVMATPLSAFPTVAMSSNTVSSWKGYSGDLWQMASTSIIETVSAAITDPTTWNSLTSWRTGTVTPLPASRPDGCLCDALTVVVSSNDGSVSTSSILWPSATEPATGPLSPLRPLGTALKPAFEPIVMARKPLSGSVAENVLRYGTGAINVDATRIGTNGDGGRWPPNLLLTAPIFDGGVEGVVGGGVVTGEIASTKPAAQIYGSADMDGRRIEPARGDTGTYSRFFQLPVEVNRCQYCGVPNAGLSSPLSDPSPQAPSAPSDAATSPDGTLDSTEAATPDPSLGTSTTTDSGLRLSASGNGTPTTPTHLSRQHAIWPESEPPSSLAKSLDAASPETGTTTTTHARWTCDTCAEAITSASTSPSRDYPWAFLIPKSARSDREPNAYGKLVGGLEERRLDYSANDLVGTRGRGERSGVITRANHHPTVKPVELMRHLVRLVTPIGGTVLDCFAGSGSTVIAAEQEGFAWIAIEREQEYVQIMEARLAGVQRGLGLDVA